MAKTRSRAAKAPSSRLMVLMFTDLVGSTAVKDQLGKEAYGRLLNRHDAFIREALQLGPSGQIQQDTGDGYFLSFESIAHGVLTALMFQWLMSREPWPVPFASRVGIHLGEVDETTNSIDGRKKFVSSAIDITNRVMSLAQGGQILLTGAVYDAALRVVRAHPPVEGDAQTPALKWAEHGAYVLKGSTEPIEIFEVGAQGVAPFTAPPDTEKATRASEELPPSAAAARRSRRTMIRISITAAACAATGIGTFAWFHRSDPLAEMRRLEIEREVSQAMTDAPPTLRQHIANFKEVDLVESSDNADFEILSDRRTVDLRNWQNVPNELSAQYVSPVNTSRRIAIKKIAPVQFFKMEARTSGRDVLLDCLDQRKASVIAQIGDVFVANDRMKVRQISVDVSDVPLNREFNLSLATTSWNSIQTQGEQWLGSIGYKKSFLISMLVLFPAKRPFKSYSLEIAPTVRDAAAPYNGPKILLTGPAKDWIYWEVPNPEAGHVYRILWTW